MFTALYLLLVLPIVGGLFYLFGVVRVWRLSHVVAVLMFFFWPVGVYALFKYWGEKQDNPRTPLLLALLAFAVWGGCIGWGAAHAPKFVDEEGEASLQSQFDAGSEDAIARRVRRSLALASLPRRAGSVDIPDVPVAIDVPEHFRFIDRGALLNAFADSDDRPGDSTVGWLVHERVDLSAADAWHVEVDYLGDGYVASNDFAAAGGDALLARAQDAARKLADGDDDAPQLVAFAEAPTFDPAAARVSWVEELTQRDRAESTLDCHAIQLGRKGAMLFSIIDIAARRQELCLRSVRMLAARAHFGPGQSYADHSRMLDRNAPYALADLVTGSYFAEH